MIITHQRQWFAIFTAVICGLLALAYFGDLTISTTVINYNSWWATIAQSFGELPVYLVPAFCGQIFVAYGWRSDAYWRRWLIGLGFAITLWQISLYVSEFEDYLTVALTNASHHQPVGLANSDTLSATTPLINYWLGFIIFSVIFCGSCQWLLAKQSNATIKRWAILAVFALEVTLLAYNVNVALKNLWGRVRPYQLNASHSNFTNWLTINGNTGFKSFPSGHTMAATLMFIFGWFAPKTKQVSFAIFALAYAIIIAISRIIIGAHFLSDVTFSFGITLLIIFLLHQLALKLLPQSQH